MVTQLQQPADYSSEISESPLVERIDFDLEPEDLLSFINYHYVDSPGVRRQRYLLAAMGFGILASLPLMIMLGWHKSIDEMRQNLWPLLLGPVGFLICYPLFYRWSIRRNCQRIMYEGDRRGYFGPRSLSLETYGVRESTIRGETIRSWASVCGLVTVRQHALIYTSPTEAFVVPKRAFKDDDAFDAFMKQASERARRKVETA